MIKYTPEQERAIDAIVEWYGEKNKSEFYLAGYAGTGKSTVVKEAIDRIKEKYGIGYVPTGAYTGKAAYVLRNKGNANAQTIHSMIYKVSEDRDGNLTFILDTMGVASMADMIVLDECSMISYEMAKDLRSFNKKLLIMGDPGQLPPIHGEGVFTNREPDFFLHEIHRQAAESPIIELATMARNGQAIPMGYSKGGVKVLPLTNANAEAIFNPETQVLCGLNRIRWSVTQLMRSRLGYGGKHPIIGEKILCKKNNRERGLFNGGSGTLDKIKINEADYNITATIEGDFKKNLLTDPYLFRQHFDNGTSKRDVTKKNRFEFDWGYIWSVHSAQGSGWRDVTLIDNSSSFRENKWKHLYTGITRAEENLTILI